MQCSANHLLPHPSDSQRGLTHETRITARNLLPGRSRIGECIAIRASAAGSATTTISVPVIGNGIYDNPGLTFSVQITDFLTQQPLAAGNSPRSIAAADFNGDGASDLVVANGGNNGVSVFLNTSLPKATAASFATPNVFAAGLRGYTVVVGDINGDGKPDLAVANHKDVGLMLSSGLVCASFP